MRAHSTTSLESNDNGLTAYKKHRKASSQHFTTLRKDYCAPVGKGKALGSKRTAKHTKLCSGSVQGKSMYPAFSVTSEIDKFNSLVSRPSLTSFLATQSDVTDSEVIRTARAREAGNIESTASLAWNTEVATPGLKYHDASSSQFDPTEHGTPSSMLAVEMIARWQTSSETLSSSAWVDYAETVQYARHENNFSQNSLQIAVLYFVLLAYSMAKNPPSGHDISKVSIKIASLLGSNSMLAPQNNESTSSETIDPSKLNNDLVLLTSPTSPVPRSLQHFRYRFTKRNASTHCNQFQKDNSVVPVITVAKNLGLRYSSSHLRRQASASTARKDGLSAINSRSRQLQTQMDLKIVPDCRVVTALMRTSENLKVQLCSEYGGSYALCDDSQGLGIVRSMSEPKECKDQSPRTTSKTPTCENVVADASSPQSLGTCSSSPTLGTFDDSSCRLSDLMLSPCCEEAMSPRHKTGPLDSVCSLNRPKKFHLGSSVRPHDMKSDCYSKNALRLTRLIEPTVNKIGKSCSIGNAYTCLDNTALIQPIR